MSDLALEIEMISSRLRLEATLKQARKSAQYFIDMGMTARGEFFADSRHENNYMNQALRGAKSRWYKAERDIIMKRKEIKPITIGEIDINEDEIPF